MEIEITLDGKKIEDVLYEYRYRAELAEEKLNIMFRRIDAGVNNKESIEKIFHGLEGNIKSKLEVDPIKIILKS
jgi:hypothetical protein